MNNYKRNIKALEILTETQVDDIHKGTLEVLQKTGVTFEHKGALEIFRKNGCKVQDHNNRVMFPPELVEECINTTPSSYLAKGRDRKHDFILGGNTIHFSSAGSMDIIDLDTWEPRKATRKEFYDGVKVLDALDHVHYHSNYSPYFGFEGVPSCMCTLESCAAKIRNSSKHQGEGASLNSEIYAIEMAKAVKMDINGSFFASPPLTFYSDVCESAIRHMEADFPLHICSGAVMGGSAPATIAGASITNNAEILAGLVFAQIVKPGTRILASHFVFPQNMINGSPAFGSVGGCLHQVAFNQMWSNKYKVPIYNSLMGTPAAKKIDFQSGYEKAYMALTAAMSGANILWLFGGVHGELSHHPLQAILDDDIAGIIVRFIKGVEVTEETLAVDLINKVGPIPGFYLGEKHTRDWWKQETYIPKSADLSTYAEWKVTGKRDTLDYAKERMEDIIANHNPIPLTSTEEQTIEDILMEARNYYKNKGIITDEEWKLYMKETDSV
jgi:trimethylamine--corrinoid protein Co-methyltransferase